MNFRLQGIGMTSQRTRDRMVKRLQMQGIRNPQLLSVMATTPRHIFVDEALASRSYEDTALPIGHNQTISQPYIVARMTELLLENGPRQKVLEIGTGCGYQTAVLAQLVDQVYTVERIGPLLKKAKDRLWELGLKNIRYLHSDGGWGWPEFAPYDGVLVAAAPTEIPEALLAQMAVGAVMIIPIGDENGQQLHRVIRTESGFEDDVIEPVVFVPFLTGKQ
ncbi:protein-L-isoaspartate(D-aspartate) O-methyltransferase [methane-oxidizing endosymbiont of Gigantopelta aegis]|uniref:protein-L-isoaspartate(D-aspartate) O-methyltransferase n=1 Tax=methane-oxidizing endosymbiont of Gigantopelta aegis TaxID=2794938 RepID=UPI0018DE5185|nr:protein-L-isoaspartate(D-aspartate) O-methyltransferase [methane-oxidizing endosymbiont of Gigantopelta aegis]